MDRAKALGRHQHDVSTFSEVCVVPKVSPSVSEAQPIALAIA